MLHAQGRHANACSTEHARQRHVNALPCNPTDRALQCPPQSSLERSAARLPRPGPTSPPFSGGRGAGKAARAPRSMAVAAAKAPPASSSIWSCMLPGMGTSENQEARPAVEGGQHCGMRVECMCRLCEAGDGTSENRDARPGDGKRKPWARGRVALQRWRGVPACVRAPCLISHHL